MIRVAIIGDSSSSGIGMGKQTYPYCLYELMQRHEGIEVNNFSVPGLTSSDACMLYHSKLKKEAFAYLVIYLGNNEGAQGPSKPYVNYYAWAAGKIFRKKKTSFKDYAYKKKYVFNANIAFENGPIVKVADFIRNIESILKDAEKRNMRTILINPAANKRFPGGLGNKNAVFFKLVGCMDKRAYLLEPTDESSRHLIEGMKFQEEGMYNKMFISYGKISGSTGRNPASFVARNNTAVYYASNEFSKARQAFMDLVGFYNGKYDPIIYFNLHLLYKKNEKKEEAALYLGLAYESDTSLYRVRKPYREAISKASENCNATCLDLEDVLDEKDFIDYCHPTPEGHSKIALRLKEVIAGKTGQKTESRYQNFFITPDYYNNPGDDIIDYYFLDYAIKSGVIKEKFCALLDTAKPSRKEPLTKYLENFLAQNSNHPVFTETRMLLTRHLPASHEVLNFPEFYIYRLLYNYYRIYENEIKKSSTKYILLSSDYKKIILKHNNLPLTLVPNTDISYLDSVRKKLVSRIECAGIFEDTVFFRLKTIIYWYTREAFRYGTHSRYSMLYDRPTIDKLIESAVVCSVICRVNNLQEEGEWFSSLLGGIEKLIDIHEKHAKGYARNILYDSVGYRRELEECKKELMRIVNREKERAYEI